MATFAAARAALLNGEVAEKVEVTYEPPAGSLGDRWPIWLHAFGGRDLIAVSDYRHAAKGVAEAVAAALECDVEWSAPT